MTLFDVITKIVPYESCEIHRAGGSTVAFFETWESAFEFAWNFRPCDSVIFVHIEGDSISVAIDF